MGPRPGADVLGRFSEATRRWFTGAFAAPTAAQAGAWDAISSGDHTLVVGEVLSLAIGDDPGDALTYYRGAFGRLV